MIEKLIGAVAESLFKKWGEEYEVYTESVYQNVKKPCFFVECESVEKKELLGGRFFIRADIKVSIEDDGDIRKQKVEKMIGDVFAVMNFVCVEGKTLQGRSVRGKWENDSFVVRGTYSIFCGEERETHDLMQTVEIKGM